MYIFSDTVCPWCYIGKKRLEKAISNHKDTKFKQTWRPFQLNPGMPPDGMDRQEYLISKFGSASNKGWKIDIGRPITVKRITNGNVGSDTNFIPSQSPR